MKILEDAEFPAIQRWKNEKDVKMEKVAQEWRKEGRKEANRGQFASDPITWCLETDWSWKFTRVISPAYIDPFSILLIKIYAQEGVLFKHCGNSIHEF